MNSIDALKKLVEKFNVHADECSEDRIKCQAVGHDSAAGCWATEAVAHRKCADELSVLIPEIEREMQHTTGGVEPSQPSPQWKPGQRLIRGREVPEALFNHFELKQFDPESGKWRYLFWTGSSWSDKCGWSSFDTGYVPWPRVGDWVRFPSGKSFQWGSIWEHPWLESPNNPRGQIRKADEANLEPAAAPAGQAETPDPTAGNWKPEDDVGLHVVRDFEPPPEPQPIPLNGEQEKLADSWAKDDRLWTTQETIAFNLRTFARAILSKSHITEGVTGEFTGPHWDSSISWWLRPFFYNRLCIDDLRAAILRRDKK